MKYIMAFLGGAIAGASLALLFAPERGEDLRNKIKEILRRNGLLPESADESVIVEQIVAELKEETEE